MADTLIDSVLLDFFLTSSDPIIPMDNVHLINEFLSASDNEEKTELAQRLMIQTIRNLGFETRCIERILQGYITSLLKVDYGFRWITKDYRSHFLHSVYNYLTGLYLMRHDFLGNILFSKIDFEALDNIYTSPSSELLHSYPRCDYEKFHKRWAIAAFFHDISYLSQISYNAMNKEAKHNFQTDNQVFSVSLPHFEDNVHIDETSQIKHHLSALVNLIPPYLLQHNALDIISSRIAGRLGTFENADIRRSLKRIIKENFKGEYGSHDILSGLFAIKKYYYELNSYFNSTENPITSTEKIQIIQEMKDFTDAISNAALHHYDKYTVGIFEPTKKEKISWKTLPLLYLLILVDELQIWNRELVCEFKPIVYYDLQINDTALSDWFKDNWTNMLLRFVQSYQNIDTTKSMTLEIPFTKNMLKQIDSLRRLGTHDQCKITNLIENSNYSYKIYNGKLSISFVVCPVLAQLENVINFELSNYEVLRIKSVLESSWKEFSANHQTYSLFMEYLMLFEDLLEENNTNKAYSINKNNLINKYLVKSDKLYTQLISSDQLWIPIECITFNHMSSFDSSHLEQLELMYDGKTTQNIQSIMDHCLNDFKKHISIKGINNQALIHIVGKIRNIIQNFIA